MPSTFTVNRLADDPLAGSLRWAITQANQTPGDDVIDFEPALIGTINLAGALPNLSSNIDLQGPGAELLTVRRDTGGNYRIFTVTSGATVVISGLTITNGFSAGDAGGGIANGGTLALNHSTVSGNSADPGGGGIFNNGTLTLNSVTVSGNSSTFGSGGIGNGGTLTLNNSTVSGNSAGAGGIGGGIRIEEQGTLSARNTIIAGNTAPTAPDLSGNLGSLGHNLVGDRRGGSGFHETDLLDVDPLLGELQDNGGPTWTQALLPGSPALDAGDNTDAPEFDQRGLPRIVAGRIDIGAFELQTPPVTIESVLINDGSAQRSMVNSLTVTFDQVVTLDPGAFELRRQDGSLVGLSVATSEVDGRTIAILTFTGSDIIGSSLADGNYTLTIRSDMVHDAVGRPLDGDSDGTPGGDRSDAIFRLYGDSDGDRDVDLLDLGRFLSTFGRRQDDPHFLAYLDFNGDDRVGLIDLLAFVGRLGTQLNP